MSYTDMKGSEQTVTVAIGFFLSRVTMVTLPLIGQLARAKAAILCEKGWASAGRFRFLNQLTYFTKILRNSWL